MDLFFLIGCGVMLIVSAIFKLRTKETPLVIHIVWWVFIIGVWVNLFLPVYHVASVDVQEFTSESKIGATFVYSSKPLYTAKVTINRPWYVMGPEMWFVQTDRKLLQIDVEREVLRKHKKVDSFIWNDITVEKP